MQRRLTASIMIGVTLTMSGCASWCDNSMDQEKCLTRVHTAQAVGAIALVVTGAVLVAKNSRGGGYDDQSYRGDCQHTWQYAKDGSICGNRAADARPGGW